MAAIPKEAVKWWGLWNLKNPSAKVDPAKMKTIRHQCQTNHGFLAKCLGYPDFIPEVHNEVWDFFLHKDPSIQPFAKFAAEVKDAHDRALFLPRNCFKSTANMVDIVQFIICWPDIRILLVTPNEDLGKKFLKEMIGHFKRDKDGNPKLIRDDSTGDESLSLFQLAFPEFCVQGTIPTTTFTVPCRSNANIKEETIEYAGVETSQSGIRADVLVFDDCVSNENSKNSLRLAAVKSQMAFHRKLMNPNGFCNYIGTLYNPNDAYGYMIRAEEANNTLFWDHHKRRADSHDVEGRKCLTKIMLRPAMWEKGDKQLEIDSGTEMKEADWNLFFPQRCHWKWIMGELARDPETFHSQLMNSTSATKTVRFNRAILAKHTRTFTEMPTIQGNGLLIQSWDTAYSDSSLANYTVGFTALILGGRFYFMDMVRGQFSDYEIATVISQSMAKWKPSRVVFEEANGVHWLAREIRREMERMNFYVQLEFADLIGNKKNRKSILAAPVAKMFQEGRIILSNGLPFLDKIYDELEGFQNGAPNDDIVDAMSLAINYFQHAPEASVRAMRADVDEEMNRRRDRSLYNHIYGLNTGNDGFVNHAEQVSGEEIPSYVAWSPMDCFK